MSLADGEARRILDAKGRGGGAPVADNANAIPVRRTLTLARALSRKPLAETRVLDLACQEGCYAIEAALSGARVIGVEGRADHVARARTCLAAADAGARCTIEQGDVRAVSMASHGRFDIVLMLGILYHLDAGDAVGTLRRIGGLCDDVLIVDTHFAPAARTAVEIDGVRYEGAFVREHGAADDAATRLRSGQASLDNEFAFYFTRDCLVRLLMASGFPVVLEALSPLDVTKPADRATFVALKRDVHDVKVYPWIAGLGEAAIAERARPNLPTEPGGLRARIARAANAILHPMGFDLRRR